MKRESAIARVRKAEMDLAIAERELAKSAMPWKKRFQKHRTETLLVGGFASGLALTLLPTRWWARVGATVGSIAAIAARSVLTPAVIGAALSQLRRADASEQDAAETSVASVD